MKNPIALFTGFRALWAAPALAQQPAPSQPPEQIQDSPEVVAELGGEKAVIAVPALATPAVTTVLEPPAVAGADDEATPSSRKRPAAR